MTKFLTLVTVLLGAVLAGCAGTPISQFTHSDLQNAAKIANANGYPARAAVWTADDQLLTAAESQVQACKDAIAALKPSSPGGTIGVATATELAAEAVAAGIPPAVKANCEPLPLPGIPLLPKLP